MPDRTSKPDHPLKPPKRPRDFNARAFQVVGELTGTLPRQAEEPEDPIKAAAAALGRRGGLKGGRVRSDKMTPEERQAAARNAALVRWKPQEQERLDREKRATAAGSAPQQPTRPKPKRRGKPGNQQS
jgi:hypothetical protein